MSRRRKRGSFMLRKREWLYRIGEALINDHAYSKPTANVLMILEIVIAVCIVRAVKYTEIDWKAYMQQAEAFVNGEYDYGLLVGDTGPLVYPAGHLYIYTALLSYTDMGKNIRLAQNIFAGMYLFHMFCVFTIYVKSTKVPPYMLIMMVITSYRIHSIFLLRLFNDCVAMTIFYVAVLLWTHGRWTLGIVAYSLALSVKMNILLFAPAVAIIYWFGQGCRSAVLHALLALSIQVILALPFLVANPVSYFKSAFNFGRVFEHKWTVNWRFLPPTLFSDARFHNALLICHVVVLIIFLYVKFFRRLWNKGYLLPAILGRKTVQIKPEDMILLLAGCNTIGVAFCRSLHYQFYEWYYHFLPFLVWKAPFPMSVKITLLASIEISWNVYPSKVVTSALLHVCHAILLIGVFCSAKNNYGKSKQKHN